MLVVNPEKYASFEAFKAAAEETPGELIIGGTHAASIDRMAFLGLNAEAGFDLNFIPYDNEGAASANLLSGNIDGMFNEISAIQGYMESGEMIPVLALADDRLEAYPDIPTTAENGWDLTFGQHEAAAHPQHNCHHEEQGDPERPGRSAIGFEPQRIAGRLGSCRIWHYVFALQGTGGGDWLSLYIPTVGR